MGLWAVMVLVLLISCKEKCIMSCGCTKKNINSDMIVNDRMSLPVLSEKQARARAVICQICPKYSKKENICTIDGRLMNDMHLFATKAKCPKNKWPDNETGVVKWARLTWYGIPWPIRVRIALQAALRAYRSRRQKDYLDGCGCIRPLKDLWLKTKRGGIWLTGIFNVY